MFVVMHWSSPEIRPLFTAQWQESRVKRFAQVNVNPGYTLYTNNEYNLAFDGK